MTLCSNAYCLLQISLRSILCAGQPLRAPQRVPRSNTSWRSQIGTKWKTNSHQRWLTVMGSAKHTVINANGQSVVYWLRFRPVERLKESLGESRLRFFRRWASPWCIQSYSWFVVSNTSVDAQAAVLNITVKLTVKLPLRVSAWVSLTFVQFVQLVQNQRFLS